MGMGSERRGPGLQAGRRGDPGTGDGKPQQPRRRWLLRDRQTAAAATAHALTPFRPHGARRLLLPTSPCALHAASVRLALEGAVARTQHVDPARLA